MDIQIGSNGYLFSPPIGHSKGFFLLLMKGSCSISMTIFGRFLIKSFNYTFISLSALGSLQFPLIYRKMDAFDSRTDFSVQGLSLQIIDIFHFWVIIHDFSNIVHQTSELGSLQVFTNTYNWRLFWVIILDFRNIVHNTSELEVFRFSPTLTIGDFSELLFLIFATLYITPQNLSRFSPTCTRTCNRWLF